MAALPTSNVPPDQVETVNEKEEGESERGEKEDVPDPGGTKSQVTVKKKPCIFCLDCVCPYEGEKLGEDYILTCTKCNHQEVLTTENTGLSHDELDLYVGDVIMNRFRDILREQEEMKKMDVNDPDYANDKYREVHYAYEHLFEMMKGTINSMHLVLSEFRENYNTEMIRRLARETEELERLRQRTKQTTLELTVTVSGSKETDDLVINPDSYKIPTSVKVECFQKGKQGVRLADKVVLETVLPKEVIDEMTLFTMRLREYRSRTLQDTTKKGKKESMENDDDSQSKKKRKRKKRQKYIKYDYSNKENVQNCSKTDIHEILKIKNTSNEQYENDEKQETAGCHMVTQTEAIELTENVLSVYFDITVLENDFIKAMNEKFENSKKKNKKNRRGLHESSTNDDMNTESDENDENICTRKTDNVLDPKGNLENEDQKKGNLKKIDEVVSQTVRKTTEIITIGKNTETTADEVWADSEQNQTVQETNDSSLVSQTHGSDEKETSDIISIGKETYCNGQMDGNDSPEVTTKDEQSDENDNETESDDNWIDEEYVNIKCPYVLDVVSIESEYNENVSDKATQTSLRTESFIKIEEDEAERHEREKCHHDEMLYASTKVLDDMDTLDDIGEFTVRKVNQMFTEILHGIGDYRENLLKERRDRAVRRMEKAIRNMTEKVDRVKMEVVDELTDAYREKVVKQYQERTKCDDNQAKLRRFELLMAHYEKTNQGDKLDELLEEITTLAEEMGHDVKKRRKKVNDAEPEQEVNPELEVDENDLNSKADLESDEITEKGILHEEDLNLEIQELDI